MKRIVSIIGILLLLVSVAHAEGELRGYSNKDGYTYVTLGRYMQSVDGGAPEENRNTWTWSRNVIKNTASMSFDAEPLLWRILRADDSQAYLLSEYVLFAMPMHTNVTEYKKIGSDFANTQLCAYLNSTFSETAFTADELTMLVEDPSGVRVSLLTSADVKNKAYGLGSGAGMKALATEYAIRVTNVFVYKTQYGAHSPYWVQDQSTVDIRHARCTKEKGTLGHIISDRENEGVRPAVTLDLSACTISGGSGTKSDPYIITPKEQLPAMLRLLEE